MKVPLIPDRQRIPVLPLSACLVASFGAIVARADPNPPAPYSFHVGELQCVVLYDATASYDAPSFFINAPAKELARALSASGHQPDRDIDTPYAALLVRTSHHTILIDTGAGPSNQPGCGQLLTSLAAVGLMPEAIDTVILTHGHLDHIGGTLTADGSIAFPRARFVMARAEWEFWNQEAPDLSALQVSDAVRVRFVEIAHAKLRPLRDRIEFVDTNREVRPGVSALLTPGHTPGHMLVKLDSAGQSLLYVSDLVFIPLALEHPEWHSRYECDPAAAGRSKRGNLTRAANDNLLVYAMHFPWPGLGRVAAQGDHWQWVADVSASAPGAQPLSASTD